ncbi:hypothetical protein [Okeania sp. SIO1I7]|nr:hypothetical protein [Okeania sp. SIO1I7]
MPLILYLYLLDISEKDTEYMARLYTDEKPTLDKPLTPNMLE